MIWYVKIKFWCFFVFVIFKSYRISSAQKILSKDSRRVSITFGGEYSTRRRKVREKVPAKHMWNALQLAISISVPREYYYPNITSFLER